jgi:hypothetical protein
MAEQETGAIMAMAFRILEARYVAGEVDGEYSASFQVRTTSGLHGAEFPVNPDLTCDRLHAAHALRALAASVARDPLDQNAITLDDDETDSKVVIDAAWIDEAEVLAAGAATVTIPAEHFEKLLAAARNGLRPRLVNGRAGNG